MLHIAYGPNVNPVFMRHICPNTSYFDEALLWGHKLVFRKNKDNCFITVEETGDESDVLPVCVWSLSNEDERLLDQYVDSLNCFKKVRSVVSCITRKQVGYLYCMDSGSMGIPTTDYFQCIQRGYYYAGFSPMLLHDALRQVDQARYDRVRKAVLDKMCVGSLEPVLGQLGDWP